MNMKGPPGWNPDEITSRIDGWVVDPDDEDRIPARVAEMIVRALPQLGGGCSSIIEEVRARMLCRQRMVARLGGLK
jgi:hypothetical protein